GDREHARIVQEARPALRARPRTSTTRPAAVRPLRTLRRRPTLDGGGPGRYTDTACHAAGLPDALSRARHPGARPLLAADRRGGVHAFSVRARRLDRVPCA